MKINFKQELVLFFIAVLPILYMVFTWNNLPESVPIHFNMYGEADNYTSKFNFAVILLGLVLFTYVLMLLLPYIDPKEQIKQMGEKFFKLRLIMLALVAAVCAFIVYMASVPNANVKYSALIIGVFFILMGNYFQTIKPNYFLGFKTPWTLHSEDIWKKTHVMASKLLIGGGLLIIFLFLFLSKVATFIAMLVIVLSTTFIPLIYSYYLYQKASK